MLRLKRLVGYAGALACAVVGMTALLASSAPQGTQAGPPPPAQGRAGAPPAPAPAPPPSPAAIERASTILAEARKALGGPALDGLKTLTASGRTRRVRG